MLSLIFLNLTVLLIMAIALLHFSSMTSDPRWKILCGKALLFSVIPIVFPMVIVLPIWAVILIIILLLKRKEDQVLKQEIKELGAWKCHQCSYINQRLNIVCWKCGADKHQE